MRSFLVAVFLLAATGRASSAPALVPAPDRIVSMPCRASLSLATALRFPPDVDSGGFELLRDRWKALGIAEPRRVRSGPADVTIRGYAAVPRSPRPQSYRLVTGSHVEIVGADAEGRFDGLMTLAQLPQRERGRWVLPCVDIADEPAMRWRILSDDVSRGPFPTMAYAKERIRTLASLKLNGWSPYMEQVVSDPRAPYVAWPSGWSAAQLHELGAYARRYHVALIPEQQTFAHMHETLKWETHAPLAELPHGYLLAQSDPATYAYLGPLVREVLAATAPVPFFHLGADEPIDLGRGRTPRTPQVFAAHVTRAASFLDGSGARPIIWDDAIQQDRSILRLIPPQTVIATFHYGVEKTYRPYIDAIATAGFAQLVSPGAANWNEIYPDLATAYANVARFVGEAKGAPGVLGMFMTVWHDDGESLYEATWPAVAYAAATAWQRAPVDDAQWHAAFARAFFGTDDARYPRALDALEAIRTMLATAPETDPPDYVFWHDPFASGLQARAQRLDLRGVRTRAEAVLTDVWTERPPLHPQAVEVMRLSALRYDQLARRLQIGKEAREYYDDGRAHATKPNAGQVYRSLNVAKYLCWEMRNAIADIAPLYASAWRYESTPAGLDRILTRYHVAQDDAQRCADRIDTVEREDYLRGGRVPAWDQVMPSAR